MAHFTTSHKQSRTRQFFSGYILVFLDPTYRSLFFTMLLAGIGLGMITPYISLWATTELHVSSAQASHLLIPMSIAGIAINMSLARIADRLKRRKPFIIGLFIVSGAVRLMLSFVHSYLLAFIFFSFMAVGPYSFMFAYLNDVIQNKEKGVQSGRHGIITATQRTSLSLGWVFGPALGAIASNLWGYPVLFACNGILFFACLVLVWRWPQDTVLSNKPVASAHQIQTLPGIPISLPLFAGAALFVATSDYTRAFFAPLFFIGTLHLSPDIVGVSVMIVAFGEIFFMPLAGYLADFHDIKQIYLLGIFCQSLYMILMSFSTGYWQIIGLQILYSFVSAIIISIGMIFAQRLYPDGISTAMTIFTSSSQLAPLCCSLLMGTLSANLSIIRLFQIAALFCLPASAIMHFIRTKEQRSAQKVLI